MDSPQPNPRFLWLVRHGESAGNVARDLAESEGLHTIDVVGRDIDVPLSSLGERQSRALGRWFGQLDAEQQRPARLPGARLVAAGTEALGWSGLTGREPLCEYCVG